jgi:hypothetical protein
MNMTAKTITISRKWVILASLCLFVAAILYYAHFSFGPDTCLYNQRDRYFRLPADATDIEFQTRHATRSCTVRLKFKLPIEQLDAFVSTTFITLPLSSSLPPQAIGGLDYLQESTGWTLNSVTTFLAGEAMGPNELFLDEQTIFVDTSDPDLVTVYLTTKRNWL